MLVYQRVFSTKKMTGRGSKQQPPTFLLASSCESCHRTRDGTQEICGVFCHLKSEYPGVILIGYENMYIIQIYSHSDMKIQILIYSHSDLLATTHLQCLQSGSSFLYLPYPCVTVSPEMFRWFLSKSRTVKC